jgi:hypothetical protein
LDALTATEVDHMVKPRRCYIYTTEEQLAKDVADGIVSERTAESVREFGEWLAKLSKANRRPPPAVR